jgi:hypothetical protein
VGADPVADWARSGVLPITGRPGGPLLVPPGRAATLAGELADRFASVTGVQFDGARLLSERAAFTGHQRRGTVSAGGACRLLPTADGWAAVSCTRPDDAALLGALACQDAGDDPWPAVTPWLRQHTGAELAERAELLGIAASPVARRPDPPELPVPLTARPPAGLLVADFSALWAGPLCAHLLGLAGARVVKVETPWRPDGARSGNAAFYRLLHAGHRSVTLDPHTGAGREAMAALVAAADIVIESSRPRALARFGLDAEASAADGTTWVSITAYGRASDRIGFGDDVAAGAGLVARGTDGAPLFCGDAIADPLTGLAAAVLAACAPPGGALLDVAMSDVAAASLAPSVAPSVARSVARSRAPSVAERSEISAAARHDGHRWVVDTAEGTVPVAVPRRRPAGGTAASRGEHTAEVLAELGIRC